MPEVLIVLSGGTIDAEHYEETPADIMPREKSLVPQALNELGINHNIIFYTWLMKDSKQFSPRELEELASILRWEGYEHVVITHGTDRMPDNARALKRMLADAEMTVVFTGSMIPLSHGMQSDGYQNLADAVAAALKQPHGVTIAMHGRVMNPDNARKDFERKEIVEHSLPV